MKLSERMDGIGARLNGLSDKQRLGILVVGAATLVAMIGALNPQHPTSVKTAAAAQTSAVPESVQIWSQALARLDALRSYRVQYKVEYHDPDVLAFDVSVSVGGNWIGTVTTTADPSHPLHMAFYDQTLYAQGGTAFTAVAQRIFSLDANHAALARDGEWINLYPDTGPSMGVQIANAVQPYADPASFRYFSRGPAGTPTMTMQGSDVDRVVTLTDAEGTKLIVAPGDTEYPIGIDDGNTALTWSAFDQPVNYPSFVNTRSWVDLLVTPA